MSVPWWELRSGDEYTVEHDGLVVVFEGGFGDDGGMRVTEADAALVVRHMGSQARTAATFCEVLEEACDELSQCPLERAAPQPTRPANDTHRALLERVFALIAPPEKSTPAGESPPAG